MPNWYSNELIWIQPQLEQKGIEEDDFEYKIRNIERGSELKDSKWSINGWVRSGL